MGATQSQNGTSTSTPVKVELQREYLCATGKENVLDKPVTLRLSKLNWPFDRKEWKVVDEETNQVYFKIEKGIKSKSKGFPLVLEDQYGCPVFWLRTISPSGANGFDLPFVSNSKFPGLNICCWFTQHGFQIYGGIEINKEICKVDSLTGNVMVFHFKDALTGTQRSVLCNGDWEVKNCTIYELKVGVGGRGVPIAWVRLPMQGSLFGGRKFKGYLLKIDGGVDIALMVAICMVMDICSDCYCPMCREDKYSTDTGPSESPKLLFGEDMKWRIMGWA